MQIKENSRLQVAFIDVMTVIDKMIDHEAINRQEGFEKMESARLSLQNFYLPRQKFCLPALIRMEWAE